MKKMKLILMSVFCVGLVVSLGACAKKPKPEESTVANAIGDSNPLGDSDSGKAMGLETAHFAYDSYLLDDGAKSVLKTDAGILKDHPALKVQIEGHCDQRGGIQYNIALGEKRAKAAKHFLTDLGIGEDRVSVVSYGKERPIDPAETEEAYAKNRRANFVITERK